jgi:hypothetical protein
MNTAQHNHETLTATLRYVQIKDGIYTLNVTLTDSHGVQRKYKTTTADVYLIDKLRDEDNDIKWEARQNAVELVCKKHQLPVLFYYRDNSLIEVTLEI